jgi:hypothetical protein
MRIFNIILLIIITILVGTLFAYYLKSQNEMAALKVQINNPSPSSSINNLPLKDAISRLIEIPTNETPTEATITNADELSNRPFFAHAQTGDKVLIFPQAQKAYLYRPSINKLIEVSSVTTN